MTDEKPPSSGAARPPGGRRPATIDLIATEIQSWPVTQASAPPAEPATERAPAEPATEDAPPTAPAEAAAQPQPVLEAQAEKSRPEPEPVAADPPSETPQSSSELPPPPPPPPPRARTPWLALIGAGVAGGAVALAAVAIANLLQGDARPLDARLAGVEQRLRDLAARPVPAAADNAALDEIKSRLGRLETAPAAPRASTTDPAFANRVAAIEGEVKALTEQIGILNRRSDEAAAVAREARARGDATAAALADFAQKAAQPAAPAIERGELEALANRVAAVERSEKSAAAGDRAVRLALAAALLKAAVERGDPFAAELNAAKSLGADAKLLTALEPFAVAGVPTAAALSRELKALVPALLAASGTAPPAEGGIFDKFKANAEKLVRIRPVGEIAGSDPSAVIARIEVRVGQTDLNGALAELTQLPEAARAPAFGWIKTAQARGAAVDAARRLSSDALAGLGK
jgi:hypothetical protein